MEKLDKLFTGVFSEGASHKDNFFQENVLKVCLTAKSPSDLYRPEAKSCISLLIFTKRK